MQVNYLIKSYDNMGKDQLAHPCTCQDLNYLLIESLDTIEHNEVQQNFWSDHYENTPIQI